MAVRSQDQGRPNGSVGSVKGSSDRHGLCCSPLSLQLCLSSTFHNVLEELRFDDEGSCQPPQSGVGRHERTDQQGADGGDTFVVWLPRNNQV